MTLITKWNANERKQGKRVPADRSVPSYHIQKGQDSGGLTIHNAAAWGDMQFASGSRK